MPHLSLTRTGLPAKSFRNGLGFTGIAWFRRVRAPMREATHAGMRSCMRCVSMREDEEEEVVVSVVFW